ncbi:MAG: FIST C-terminal domain-containing protein [Thermoanaerobaculia bacterium]|nr:FIST C-terminal domain-containing protein [Thermoanaerobaculia bacterium]
MRVEQSIWTKDGWSHSTPRSWPPGSKDSSSSGCQVDPTAQLVLSFGSPSCIRNQRLIDEIFARWPNASFFGCTTAGEIHDTRVTDGSLVCTAVTFATTRIISRWQALPSAKESLAVGTELARGLESTNLRHVLVLSNGIDVHGTELVRGLTENLPSGVSVTGGLSADGSDFHETLVISGREIGPRRVAVIALYGPDLEVGIGSIGGWDPFGPEHLITRAEGNTLYTLDGRPALKVYEASLGEHAASLPPVGLHYPLAIRRAGREPTVVRTLLSINREGGSLTFAGDVPEGSYARVLRASFDRLVDGAMVAAAHSVGLRRGLAPSLALLVSCLGRKMILQPRTEEEVEGVRYVLGPEPILAGFYSYGEISPIGTRNGALHNQTMTITTFAERGS